MQRRGRDHTEGDMYHVTHLWGHQVGAGAAACQAPPVRPNRHHPGLLYVSSLLNSDLQLMFLIFELSGPGSDWSDISRHNILQPPGTGSWPQKPSMIRQRPAPGVFYLRYVTGPRHHHLLFDLNTDLLSIVLAADSILNYFSSFLLSNLVPIFSKMPPAILGTNCGRWSHLGSL